MRSPSYLQLYHCPAKGVSSKRATPTLQLAHPICSPILHRLFHLRDGFRALLADLRSSWQRIYRGLYKGQRAYPLACFDAVRIATLEYNCTLVFSSPLRRESNVKLEFDVYTDDILNPFRLNGAHLLAQTIRVNYNIGEFRAI